MKRKIISVSSVTLLAFTLIACSAAATPTPTPAPTNVPSASAAKSSGKGFGTKSNEGGSVTVEVTPDALEVGKAITFDIAMNTHSVDLSDDMTKITILRDDAGKEYQPTAWEGPGGGGHHREGVLKFAALTSKPKFVELVIKGLAKVPERVFRWDLN